LNSETDKFYEYEKGISKKKKVEYGIVYTPPEIVDYINDSVLAKWSGVEPPRVVDPCCGTGIFLHDMANKISKRWNLDLAQVYKEYIHGFEKDVEAAKLCQDLLKCPNIQVTESSLKDDLDSYDIIVTNPPYIRIQNLDSETRDFIKENHPVAVGDTDIYIAFLDKLHDTGKIVGLICPNSWIRNKSSYLIRDKFFNSQTLCEVIDFGSEMVFDNAQVYTSILIFNEATDKLNYKNNLLHSPSLVSYSESSPSEIYLGLEKSQDDGIDIFEFCDFKIGLATLCDGLFFCESIKENGKYTTVKNKFGQYEIETAILRKCVKASKIQNKSDNTYIVFPYDDAGSLISETDLYNKFPKAHDMLSSHKDKLLSRDKGKINKEKWYGFGRDQGLKNSGEKILLPPFQKDTIKVLESQKDEYYISGYAVMPKSGFTIDQVKTFLESQECYDKIKHKAKSMSNGWIGLSKNTFKNIKVSKQFYVSA